jgi:hypothetical protein
MLTGCPRETSIYSPTLALVEGISAGGGVTLHGMRGQLGCYFQTD